MQTTFLLLTFLQASGGSPISSLILIGAMIAVFYFFMIRPQARKAKAQKKFSSEMQTGDRVVTLSGMHGTVGKLNDDNTSFVFETASNHRIQIERSAVSLELTKAYYGKKEDSTTKSK